MSDDTVICGRHGQTRATFMCRHLAAGVACGYHAAAENPDDRWPDAWCDRCDEQLDDDGEWTEDAMAFADIKVLCTHCYDAARERNRDVPELLRGAGARLDDDERGRLWGGAFADAQTKQAKLEFLHGGGRWHFDDQQRTLTFSGDDRPTIIARVRLVGSYATKSGTFQWAWAMYGHDDPLVAGVDRLRELGMVRDLAELQRTWWACPIEEAWEMAALAGYVLGARGLYRAPFDDLYWFMLIDELTTGGPPS